MKTITSTFFVPIKAQPERVFDYVSDLSRHSEWNEGLRIEAVTPGRAGVGSQYRSWGNPGNRLNEIKIIACQPPTRFAFVSRQIGFNDVRHEFVVIPQEDGTLLERIVITRMPLLTEIIWRMVLWPLFARPSMNKSLAALRDKLEHSI